MTLKTFDLHALVTSLEENLFSQNGGLVSLVFSDTTSREYLTSLIIQRSQKKGITLKHLNTIDEIHASMNELSLFATKTLYVVNGVSLSGESVALPPPGSSILLSLENKNGLPKNASDWSVVAFPNEKPWEITGRLVAWTKELFRLRKKIPSEELVQALCATAENDFMRIASEVEKISLYMGDETNVSLQQAAHISPFSHSEKEWNIAENIIWYEANHPLPSDDQADFFRFLGLLRYHLHMGLALSLTGDYQAIIKERYPKLQKKAEKVYVPKVKALGKGYFIKGNMALSELEKNVRTASHALRHYWDIFIINMRCHI